MRGIMEGSAINIRPGVGILGLFPSMNYKAWYALGELVDNALDSYLTHKEPLQRLEGERFQLRIVIEMDTADGGSLRVWDNAAGISASNYERAFVTAEAPTGSAGLSQFGIGMKSASCWFAPEWQVQTTALGEDVQRTVAFDVPRITRDQVESLSPALVAAPPEEHFTEVRLWNLYKPPQTQTIGKIRRHLASMYRNFLRDGDVDITFNGESLTYVEPELLQAPFYKTPDGPSLWWEKQVDFTLSTGERVTGFAALRDKGSTREAGLSLYRHRRLVVGSDDETFRPSQIFGPPTSFSYQRLFGELYLDDFQVTHTKDGFLWEDRVDELLRLLRDHLDEEPIPLLRQAEGHRARRAAANLTAAAGRAATAIASALPSDEDVIQAQASTAPEPADPAPTYGTESVAASKEVLLTVGGAQWKVLIETTDDPAATDWVKIRDRRITSDQREIGILFSLSHPFTQRFAGAGAEGLEGLQRVAVSLAVAETTAREAGVTLAGVVTRRVNELLSGALARE